MKAVVQRVKRAGVVIDGNISRDMGQGLVVLLGITNTDGDEQSEYLARKIAAMRIFEDEDGKMNKSVMDIGAQIMIVSNFTLYADAKKGNRPSFISASAPSHSQPLYEKFIEAVKGQGVSNIVTGEFGAEMELTIVNDGPVTIVLCTEEMMR